MIFFFFFLVWLCPWFHISSPLADQERTFLLQFYFQKPLLKTSFLLIGVFPVFRNPAFILALLLL